MLLPNATYPQMAHAANAISNDSLRDTHVVNAQHLTIEDVDDEMDANRDVTDYQVLWIYCAICLSLSLSLARARAHTHTQSFL